MANKVQSAGKSAAEMETMHLHKHSPNNVHKRVVVQAKNSRAIHKNIYLHAANIAMQNTADANQKKKRTWQQRKQNVA